MPNLPNKQTASVAAWDLSACHLSETKKRLWSAADEFRANSKLESSEYSVPVLGLIFLRYAEQKSTLAEEALKGQWVGRRAIGRKESKAQVVLYGPPCRQSDI